jgi:glycosyltransferase involved in cell wall biosynthesis
MADLISIIIPTFNRANFLLEAMASARRQEAGEMEIVVIDDGSTDGTRELVSAIPDVQYFWQPNAGVSAARNHGLRRARGQIIAFLDSDDLWDPGYLSEAVAALNATSAGFAFANWRGIHADGSVDYPDSFARRPFMKPYLALAPSGWRRLEPETARHLFVRNSAAVPSGTIFRREMLSEGWDERAGIGEDRLLLMDVILTHQCAAAFTPKLLLSHRLHDSNCCSGNPDTAKLAGGDIYVKSRILEKHGARLTRDERSRLRRSMATDYLDWGYYEAERSNRQAALALYGRAFRASWGLKPLLEISKLLLRPLTRRSAPIKAAP